MAKIIESFFHWNNISYISSFDKNLLFYATAEAVVLGFQHYLVMLGSSIMIPSILVPMMGGSDVCFEPFISSWHFDQIHHDMYHFPIIVLTMFNEGIMYSFGSCHVIYFLLSL